MSAMREMGIYRTLKSRKQGTGKPWQLQPSFQVLAPWRLPCLTICMTSDRDSH